MSARTEPWLYAEKGEAVLNVPRWADQVVIRWHRDGVGFEYLFRGKTTPRWVIDVPLCEGKQRD